MTRLPSLLLLVLLLPALALAQGAPDAGTPAPAPAPAPVPDAGPAMSFPSAPAGQPGAAPATAYDPCLEPNEDTSAVLSALRLTMGGVDRTVTRVTFQGLVRVPEAEARRLALLDRVGALSAGQAATALARLSESGLFAKVSPVLEAGAGSEATLRVDVEEHPYLAGVRLEGTKELGAREVLGPMLELPDMLPRGGPVTLRLGLRGPERDTVRLEAGSCPAPLPPRTLLARVEDGTYYPGLAWGGVPELLRRGLAAVRGEGYLLAALSARLGADAQLVVEVDEGRLEAVNVLGVAPHLEAEARDALGLEAGQVLLRRDVVRGLERLRSELPFLELDPVDRTRLPAVKFAETRDPDGTRRWVPELVPPAQATPRREVLGVELNWPWHGRRWSRALARGAYPPGVTAEGRTLTVRLRSRGAETDVDFLPVVTHVTGLTPGLRANTWLWDGGGRAHVGLEGALLVPIHFGREVPGDPEQTRLQRRPQWLVGARVQLPLLELWELGAQVHDFADTPDAWRLGTLDSSLFMLAVNRPDREYFRRRGLAAYATARVQRHWLAGLEYRNDLHRGMRPLDRPLALGNDEQPFPNAFAQQARFGSLIGRVEYASDAPPAGQVGSVFRRPETPLLDMEDRWPEETALRSFATLEAAREAFGSDAGAEFLKLVTDTAFYLRVRDEQRVRLRLRVGAGDDVPVQRDEGLGGWSSLRGYDFKEWRGSASVLTSAEYRYREIGVFVDVGTVKQTAGWTDAKLGAGLALWLGDTARLEVAWRTDDRAEATPDLRLFFGHPF